MININIRLFIIIILSFICQFVYANNLYHPEFKWERAGIAGGQINDVVTLPTSSQILFAAVDSAGVIKSNDGGQSWAPSNVGIPPYIKQLIFNNDSLYALSNYREGLYVSSDQGVTWANVSLEGLDNNDIESLTSHDNVLYAAKGSGIYRFNGERWTHLGDLPGHALNLIFVNKVMFVGTYDNGLYKSADNGQTWTAINHPLVSHEITKLINANGVIYAGRFLDFTNHDSRLAKSSDNGQTWISVDNKNEIGEITALGYQGNTIYAGGNGIFKSTNGGETWQNMTPGLTSGEILSIFTTSSGVYVGTRNELAYRNNNNSNWTMLGVTNHHWIAGTYITRDGSMLAHKGPGGFFISHNRGETWEHSGLPSAVWGRTYYANNNIVTDQSGVIYVATYRGSYLYKSKDNGKSWQGVKLPFDYGLIYSMVTEGNILYIGTESGVFYSDDEGLSWQSIDIQLYSPIISMTVSDNKLYVGTLSGKILRTSTQGRHHWEEVSGTLTGRGEVNKLISIYDAASKNTILYASFLNTGIFATEDEGKNWISLSDHLPDKAISSFVKYGSIFIAATNSGIYISKDNGKTWNSENIGLTDKSLNITHISIDQGIIMAGTRSGLFVSNHVLK